MAAEIRWTRQARSDVMEIYVVIGRASAQAADAVFDRLEARVLALAEQPRMGPRRADLRPTMRVLVESPYLILYETHPDAEVEPVQRVEIVRVIDSRRDVAKVLE